MPLKTLLYSWQAKFAGELGFHLTSQKTYGILDDAVRHFCGWWGHKDKVRETVNNAGGNHRFMTKNKNLNCSFRSDNICGHITEQHPIKLMNYAALQSQLGITPDNLSKFFEHSMVCIFFGESYTIIGSEDISDGMIEDILLSGESSALLGCLR